MHDAVVEAQYIAIWEIHCEDIRLGTVRLIVGEDNDGVHREVKLLKEGGEVAKHSPTKGSLWCALVLYMDEEERLGALESCPCHYVSLVLLAVEEADEYLLV